MVFRVHGHYLEQFTFCVLSSMSPPLQPGPLILTIEERTQT